jgi:hypothetical protein
MEYTLSNINHFTLPEITKTVYTFTDITSGDPYRVVADVYDSQNFQHILSNVVLGNGGYFWPTDNVEFDDSHIKYEIKYDSVFSTEIPLRITVEKWEELEATGTKIKFDVYTEPVENYTQHPNKKFQTEDIVDKVTWFYMSDLGILVAYNIFYSLKVKLPGSDRYKFYKSHVLVASNVRTSDPGVHVEIVPLIDSVLEETIRVRRIASEYYYTRRLQMNVRKYSIEELYEVF